MNFVGRFAVALVTCSVFSAVASAQESPVELSGDVLLDEADSLLKGQLERAQALAANRQWDEAVDVLRQASDQSGEKVIAVSPGLYVRVRDYCHRRISAMPPEALAVYRGQVDDQSKRWLDEGLAERNEQLLRQIVDQFFCSSWTDEALWALSEAALQRGDHGGARACCEQLIDTPPAVIEAEKFTTLRNDAQLPPTIAALLDRYYRRRTGSDIYELYADRSVDPNLLEIAGALRERGVLGSRLAYPRADVAAADVFARLILISIFEGSPTWAEAVLKDFAASYPEASGRLAGREVNCVTGLREVFEESKSWHRPAPSDHWTTFAGNPQRSGTAPQRLEVGRVLWRTPLEPVAAGDQSAPRRRVAEDKKSLLSYHPIVLGKQLFLNKGYEIHAYDLTTGGPLWGSQTRLFQMESTGGHAGYANRQTVGSARFTLTAHGRRLLARVGNPATSLAADGGRTAERSQIVCLDLDAEGSLVWTADPPEEGWSFEGSPLADDERVYVAMRKGGLRPQFHAACYDLDAVGTPRLLWRRMICSAESPAQGQSDEITHNLPTLAGDEVYFNSNLGAVAALDKRTGAVRWVTTYPRATEFDLNHRTTHFLRDLNPCVYDRGTVFIAPSDSRHILALDAAGGWLRWETTLADDAVHLLGVLGDHLTASGDRLWQINVFTGQVSFVWPAESPKGYGRGVLAADQIVWPTRTTLEVFDAESPQLRREIELTPRDAGGGNVVPAGDYVVIAAGNELIVLDRLAGSTKSPLEPTLAPSKEP